MAGESGESSVGGVLKQILKFNRLTNRLTIASVGLGVVGSIWVMDTMTHVIGDWVPAIVLGSGIAWGYSQITSRSRTALVARKPVTIDGVKMALIEAEQVVNQVAAELQTLSIEVQDQEMSARQVLALRSQLQDILVALKRDELRFAILGGKGVGKTSLAQWLNSHWLQGADFESVSHKLQLCDTPELFSPNEADQQTALKTALSSDLVLFVVQGDLMESELQLLQTLNRAYRRTVIVLNKQDQYLPKEQDEILTKIRDRVAGMILKEDVVMIATQPRPIKVRQHQDDGTVQEWIEEPEPQVATLTERLYSILMNDAQKLIMASSLGCAEALKVQARHKLNERRRAVAMPIVDRAQWVVAGTAFATPFPALDLLATAAINGQMVVELSNLYQQKFSIEQAKQIAKNMAEIMIKLGIVEVSTQAIASVLKTNALTYMAGGALQGVSGAYLTRIAGLALMEYWEEDSNLASNLAATATAGVRFDRLSTIVKSVFQQNQRTTFLQGFVTTAIDQILQKQPDVVPIVPPEEIIAEESLEVLPR